DAALVAGPDQAGFYRLASLEMFVPEISGSRERHRGAGSDEALHEVAPSHAGLAQLADSPVEVALADFFLFGGHIKCHGINPSRFVDSGWWPWRPGERRAVGRARTGARLAVAQLSSGASGMGSNIESGRPRRTIGRYTSWPR